MRNINNVIDLCQFRLDIAPRVELTDIRLVHAQAGPGRVTGYNGVAFYTRWDCILSVVLRGTDVANLVAQSTRRLPHASEVHESANHPGRRLARAGIRTEFYS